MLPGIESIGQCFWQEGSHWGTWRRTHLQDITSHEACLPGDLTASIFLVKDNNSLSYVVVSMSALVIIGSPSKASASSCCHPQANITLVFWGITTHSLSILVFLLDSAVGPAVIILSILMSCFDLATPWPSLHWSSSLGMAWTRIEEPDRWREACRLTTTLPNVGLQSCSPKVTLSFGPPARKWQKVGPEFERMFRKGAQQVRMFSLNITGASNSSTTKLRIWMLQIWSFFFFVLCGGSSVGSCHAYLYYFRSIWALSGPQKPRMTSNENHDLALLRKNTIDSSKLGQVQKSADLEQLCWQHFQGLWPSQPRLWFAMVKLCIPIGGNLWNNRREHPPPPPFLANTPWSDIASWCQNLFGARMKMVPQSKPMCNSKLCEAYDASFFMQRPSATND